MGERVTWPEQVRIEFQLERKEYVRAVRFFLRKRHLVSWIQGLVLVLALAAVAVLTWMIGHLNFLNTLLLVLAAMALLYMGYLFLWEPGRLFGRAVNFAARLFSFPPFFLTILFRKPCFSPWLNQASRARPFRKPNAGMRSSPRESIIWKPCPA